MKFMLHLFVVAKLSISYRHLISTHKTWHGLNESKGKDYSLNNTPFIIGFKGYQVTHSGPYEF